MTNPVVIIGLGHFGIVLAKLISKKTSVIICSRSEQKIQKIQKTNEYLGITLNENISLTTDCGAAVKKANVILIVVPSKAFRQTIQSLSPYLSPIHVIIHATKGLDIILPEGKSLQDVAKVMRRQVRTMSELIEDNTTVTKIGCISGPNLSKEIAQGLPAATVLASHFDHVIEVGKALLNSEQLRVYYSHDLIGIEFCGAIKNIIALAAGMIHGLELGHNALGFLISRGLVEMSEVGERFGGQQRSFIGLAGIGDMVTTSMSKKSRNFQFGYQFGKGASADALIQTFEEPVEGINSILILKKLVDLYKIKAPILETIYKVIHENLPAHQAVKVLLKIPQKEDVTDSLNI